MPHDTRPALTIHFLTVCFTTRPDPAQSRRGGLLRGNGRQPRSEAEEREFRRRAAALNIAISPYFRRGGTK